MTLDIGGETLGAFVVGYRYEEKAQEAGELTIWLDNRGDRFDDLAADYPGLVRGAAVDLRRGLPVAGVDTTVKLPRCWVESWRYVHSEGAGLLRLDCIDWWDKLSCFRYSSGQGWTNIEVATIVDSILGQVGLSLAAGAFGVLINFGISVRRGADQAIKDAMSRVEEYLYADEDGVIKHKELDPTEAVTYAYDWSTGGGASHPLLYGTEVAENSLQYNSVAVVGGLDGQYSGSANDAAEVALVGTRLRNLTDRFVSSDVECAERAQAELRYWQAQKVSGTVLARPNMCLRLYDVISAVAPPVGGPAIAKARVTQYVESYGRGIGLWEQRITLGRLPFVRGLYGMVTEDDVEEVTRITAEAYEIRDGPDIIQTMFAEVDPGSETAGGLEVEGKDAGSPESSLTLIAKTFSGVAVGGVASISLDMETATGKVTIGGGLRFVLGTSYIEMTEQAADPDAPGLNRGRFYVRDDGDGNSQLCVRFNTGAIVVLAEQGQLGGGEGSASSCRFWEYDGVDDTPRTVIAEGTGDVSEILTVVYSVVDSDGESSGGTTSVEPGGSKNIYDKLATLALAVAADGEVTVARTYGTVTFKVALWLVWI